jgi:hypothetical protein
MTNIGMSVRDLDVAMLTEFRRLKMRPNNGILGEVHKPHHLITSGNILNVRKTSASHGTRSVLGPVAVLDLPEDNSLCIECFSYCFGSVLKQIKLE